MTTLYCNKSSGTLHKIEESLSTDFSNFVVQIGNPITIEYKRIKMASNNFDKIGKTDVMITSSVKSVQTKEVTQESITYYDKGVIPLTQHNGLKSCVITKFDPTQYGNSVCYYNPGYAGNTISIATKFWNINDSHYIQNIMSCIKNLLDFSSSLPTPVAPYITLVDGIVDHTSAILADMEGNKLLEETHLISFSNTCDYEPFLTGIYICLPTVKDINDIEYVITSYCLQDDVLIKKDKVNNNIIECPISYFILDINSKERKDLVDFDFAASSNELLANLYKNQSTCIKDFVKMSSNASDLTIITQIQDLISKGNTNQGFLTSLFSHLSADGKALANKIFPNLINNGK